MRLIAGLFSDDQDEDSSACRLIEGGGWKVAGLSGIGTFALDFDPLALFGGCDWD